MADPTTTHTTPALASLGLLIGRTYTADGREWTVDSLVLPYSSDYPPGAAAGQVFVRDTQHGGPMVLAEEVAQ